MRNEIARSRLERDAQTSRQPGHARTGLGRPAMQAVRSGQAVRSVRSGLPGLSGPVCLSVCLSVAVWCVCVLGYVSACLSVWLVIILFPPCLLIFTLTCLLHVTQSPVHTQSAHKLITFDHFLSLEVDRSLSQIQLLSNTRQ